MPSSYWRRHNYPRWDATQAAYALGDRVQVQAIAELAGMTGTVVDHTIGPNGEQQYRVDLDDGLSVWFERNNLATTTTT